MTKISKTESFSRYIGRTPENYYLSRLRFKDKNFDVTYHSISKRNGKFRHIFIPNEKLKNYLQRLMPKIKKIYIEKVIYSCDHAFTPNKNCVSNASLHIANRFVLSLDIKDFFDNIKIIHLEKYVPNELLEFTLFNDSLPQGFATSPILANIAMIDIDRSIVEKLKFFDDSIVYSRYADDLTVSFNTYSHKDFIISEIIKILTIHGFKINKHKTLIQDKNNGRAIITGIAVSQYNIHPTRKALKKLRAARHQKDTKSIQGLMAWTACNYPKKYLSN